MSHTSTSFLLGSCVVAGHVLLSEQSSVVWKQSLFSGFGFVHPCLCYISQLRNEILNLMTEQMDPASLAALVLLGQSCRLRQARLLLHSLQIVYLLRVCLHAIFYYSLVSFEQNEYGVQLRFKLQDQLWWPHHRFAPRSWNARHFSLYVLKCVRPWAAA